MDKNQIFIGYSNKANSIVKKLLSKISIENEFKKDSLIALKPNLINATKSKKGATTDPQLVRGVIEYLKEKGFNNLMIMEGSWAGADTEEAFKYCGYNKISKEYDIPLYNLQNDNYISKSYNGFNMEIAETALRADYIINIPVLKGHCQTKITCALKNLKGCISNQEKRRFHRKGLHKPIAYLNKILRQDLIIIDGIFGDLDFEEGGNPVQMNRVIIGKDPVLIDSYAALLLGYDSSEIGYIEIASQIGVGKKDLNQAKTIEINNDKVTNINYSSKKVNKLTAKVQAKEVCSACYGNLIHALKIINGDGKLDKIKEPIKIGQGYQDEKISGIGIGSCCNNININLKGCPPSTTEIINFLRSEYNIN